VNQLLKDLKEFSCIYLVIFRVKPDADEIKDKIDEFKDWLLIQALQMYEKSRAENAREEAIDKLLLTASQEVKSQLTITSIVLYSRSDF